MTDWNRAYIRNGTLRKEAEQHHPQERTGYAVGGAVALACFGVGVYFLLRGFWI